MRRATEDPAVARRMGEVLGRLFAEGRALDPIGQAGLFQRPADAQVADIALRELRNPAEGGQLDGHGLPATRQLILRDGN